MMGLKVRLTLGLNFRPTRIRSLKFSLGLQRSGCIRPHQEPRPGFHYANMQQDPSATIAIVAFLTALLQDVFLLRIYKARDSLHTTSYFLQFSVSVGTAQISCLSMLWSPITPQVSPTSLKG